MPDAMLEFLSSLGPMDVLDILVLASIIFALYLLARGTRAVPMLLGLLILYGGLYGSARLLGLRYTEGVLRAALVYLPIALIVVFQTTLRRGLTQLGSLVLTGRRLRLEGTLDDIALACLTLASRKQGALIVLEQKQGLRAYAETGILLDAHLSYDLLVNIFAPETPLHDGAVIVQEDKVAAASCYLPLTLDPALSRKFGARHRAALGITEETDAVAVVVSEERGEISLCIGGRAIEGLDGAGLRQQLRRHTGN